LTLAIAALVVVVVVGGVSGAPVLAGICSCGGVDLRFFDVGFSACFL
jgi:hypothetical protein